MASFLPSSISEKLKNGSRSFDTLPKMCSSQEWKEVVEDCHLSVLELIQLSEYCCGKVVNEL